MKRCEACHILVDSPVSRCPLCYAQLLNHDGKPEFSSFPNLGRIAEAYNMIFRILVFLSLTTSVMCVTVNLLTSRQYWWSLIVVANILYMWIAISTALRKNIRLGMNIMIQVISLAGLVVLLGILLGLPGVVYNYILPAVFVSAMISITIIVIVRRMDLQSFILYFILMALLGFIPIVLIAFQVATVLWPSLVSALYAALSLCSLFIFADNATKVELKKRFHL